MFKVFPSININRSFFHQQSDWRLELGEGITLHPCNNE